MISNRLKMTLIDSYSVIITPLLFKGLWAVANTAEPAPIDITTEPTPSSSFSDISFGIIRTLGTIGEWYTQMPTPKVKLPYPGYSYMDTVLA